MKIDKSFFNSYLTCGKTYDNFIFEKCPMDFLRLAKNSLNEDKNGIKSVVVVITDKEEAMFEATFLHLDGFHFKIMARNFVCSKILKEIIKNNEEYKSKYISLTNGINAMLNGDIDNAIGFNTEAPMPYNVTKLAKELGKIELNIFLINTKNIYIQQAINNFISSREPYSIKVFTNNLKLPSYFNQAGNPIECPHDFMRRNVNNFILEEKYLD